MKTLKRIIEVTLILITFILFIASLFFSTVSSLSGCAIPCGHSDGRSCLFYMEYGHWPTGPDAGPER